MANVLYVSRGYVACGYIKNDCPHYVNTERVDVFGFSRNRIVLPDENTSSQEIKKTFNKKFGRNAFVFPNQDIGS